ncbi:hypothetical protein QBC34DRAFT_407964 [Podospora aff. communis PSN243]|uniref:Zn(2)-C6 fungal-type domain-containing protein n=1 Tax=Podospora aff. communis PSN243 TaxID=3040156 RepID=A0AAV9GJ71_9PEZI|nr:hypothetical protein QBC34DRAFT_407964 [Podospora aff. communis PSN243]
MPPSWSAVERVDPPPRKKSCAACIKAKRRCSQDSPSCQRCRQRRLECKYAGGRITKPSLDHESPQELVTPTPSTTHTVHVVHADSDSGSQITPTATPRVFVPPHEFAYTIPWTPSVGSTEGATGPSGSVDTPGPRFVELPTAVPPTSTGTSEVLDVLSATRPFTEISDAVAYAMKIRLQYALDRTSFAVNQMVFECSTPWSHPQLYQREMPRSIQDAQAFCALYINKSPANSLIILRVIQSRAEELVSAPLPTTPLETLARAHALLLYQIIRFFDGDISLRAGAERGMRPLEEAAFSLMTFTTFSEGTFDDMGGPDVTLPAAPGPELPMQNIPPPAMRSFWESWVFQESARRTFLMIFFFLRVYKITKGDCVDPKGSCDGKLGLFHSFTASAHLWGAKDFVDFAAAWNSKRHLIVKNGDFSEVLDHAHPDDIDAFPRILFSAVLGIDEAKLWITARGGTL